MGSEVVMGRFDVGPRGLLGIGYMYIGYSIYICIRAGYIFDF